jgi:WD40 repeat protein
MKLRAASVLILALLGTAPAGADSTRRREVVDLTRLELLRTLPKGWTHSLAPSGQAFAVFDANVVRIHDTYEGKELQVLRGHVGLIHDSAWSRDGRFIATSGYDAAVHVWEVATGKTVLRVYPHAGYACSVAFSGDGRMLATGGSEDGQVKLFDTGTGQQIRPSIQIADLSVYSMLFTPDGRHLVVNHSLANRADTSMRVFRTADGTEVKNVAAGPVSSFAVSRDGRTFAYSNARGSIILLETAAWTEVKRLDGHQTGASSIAFHPISRYLASTGRDGAVKIWDTDSGKAINTLNTKGETDARLVFGADGLSLVVSSADATVRVYGRPETWPRFNGARAPGTPPSEPK